MKRLIFLLLPLLMYSCLSGFEILDKPHRLRVKTLDAGECQLLETYKKKSSKSPSGYQYTAEFASMNESTDTIDAAIGARFGVEYVVLSSVYTNVKFYAVWTFPQPIINKKGKEFSSIKTKIWRDTHTRYINSYTLQKDYELIKGDWKFELLYKNDVVLTKVFHLI